VEVGGKGDFPRTRRSRRQMLPAGKQQQQYKQKGGSIACGRGVALTLDNFFRRTLFFSHFSSRHLPFSLLLEKPCSEVL